MYHSIMDKLYEHLPTALIGGTLLYFAEPTLRHYGSKALDLAADAYVTLKVEGAQPYLRRQARGLACTAVDKYIDLKWSVSNFIGSKEQRLDPLYDTPEPKDVSAVMSTVECPTKHIMYSYGGSLYLYFGDTLPNMGIQDEDHICNIMLQTNNGENRINHDTILARYIEMCLGPNGSAPPCTLTQLRSIPEITEALQGVDKIIVNMDESLRELVISDSPTPAPASQRGRGN